MVARLRSTVKKPHADILDCRFNFRIKTCQRMKDVLKFHFCFVFACLSCLACSGVISSSSLPMTVSALSVYLRRENFLWYTQVEYASSKFCTPTLFRVFTWSLHRKEKRPSRTRPKSSTQKLFQVKGRTKKYQNRF